MYTPLPRSRGARDHCQQMFGHRLLWADMTPLVLLQPSPTGGVSKRESHMGRTSSVCCVDEVAATSGVAPRLTPIPHFGSPCKRGKNRSPCRCTHPPHYPAPTAFEFTSSAADGKWTWSSWLRTGGNVKDYNHGDLMSIGMGGVRTDCEQKDVHQKDHGRHSPRASSSLYLFPALLDNNLLPRLTNPRASVTMHEPSREIAIATVIVTCRYAQTISLKPTGNLLDDQIIQLN
ncbi:hypothetical protein BaRGS_00004896, partial [Batillaria attramentaria]